MIKRILKPKDLELPAPPGSKEFTPADFKHFQPQAVPQDIRIWIKRLANEQQVLALGQVVISRIKKEARV